MYNKILLAYDGSIEGRLALREGAKIARQCGAETVLLAVIRPLPNFAVSEGFLTDDVFNLDQDGVRKVLDEGVARLRGAGLTAEGVIAIGDPVQQIHQHAKKIGADLIVAGHRPSGRLSRWWRGAVGGSLLQGAPCSVLFSVGEDAPA